MRGKNSKANMIKYFYKSSLSVGDRLLRRREMVVSCRRKYSVALVVDLYKLFFHATLSQPHYYVSSRCFDKSTSSINCEI